MMIGERNRSNLTVHNHPWSIYDEPVGVVAGGDDFSHYLLGDSQRYVPTMNNNLEFEFEFDELSCQESDLLMDSYTCDQFRMYEFKVRKCSRARSHDWTECPYVHPGEKARRRDPKKYHYSGTACPDFRKGSCKKGDACEYSHGVFECWLHPSRYRTQPCKDGSNCSRRICFFAHSPDQIRVISPRSYDCSHRLMFVSSPESGSPPASESPPMSPMINEVVASLRQLQLNKVKSMPCSNWVGSTSGFGSGSPRMVLGPGYSSLPNSPTQVLTRRGIRSFDILEEEPMMERVESGRGLRARMFEKLSRENPLDRVGVDPNVYYQDPNVSWI
ncbi:zinc finger CCCH domain-containing protein 20-like [Impatiens glandulifera]|uniref:zinc finger CCCH domain-containing protein 20-like n=1 Tax=Impatiens glandulifera TaxID=253017 RepID=UPI001FB13F34|nr:zinc finger CCCH domain-containing protein 20-like [Impatiens glandulifera]